jgi:hypothetical protein
MEPKSREVARIESQGVVAIVEWEPKDDSYNIVVTGPGTANSHEYHNIPYISAALHQAVEGVLTMQLHR